MLRKLGFNIANHPVITLIVWAVTVTLIGVIAIGGVFGQTLFDRLESGPPTVSSESSDADNIIAGDAAPTETAILVIDGAQGESENVIDLITMLTDKLEEEPAVTSVVTPAGIPFEILSSQPELKKLVANDGAGLLVVVNISKEGTADENSENFTSVITLLEDTKPSFKEIGFTADVISPALVTEQISEQASKDLEQGEIIALPLALIAMVLVFGGFLAAGMPLIGAMASIVGGIGALYGFSFITDIDTTVLNVLTIIGLGVSIDYGLLMISRFREVLRRFPENGKKSVKLAVTETLRTAGRTVLFSGLTIAICSSALAIFEASIMKSVAISAAAVILIAVLSSLTLLPAIFTLLGYKLVRPSFLTRVPWLGRFLKAFGDVAPEEGVFSKLAEKIQKAPAVVAVAGIGVLLLLGSSVLSLHVSSYGTPYLSKSTGQVALLGELQDNYAAFEVKDLTLVVKGETPDAIAATAYNYELLLNTSDLVAEGGAVFSQADGENYGVVTADVVSPAAGQIMVTEIRDYVTAQGDVGNVLLTGDSARDVDFNDALLSVAWIVIGIIALATCILLFLMTGSIFIPVKAFLLSVLSLGASIGVITWGFEGGHLAGLLNFDASEIVGISPIILVLIVVFGFGLAMDYEMFLISRIKEEFDKTKDNRVAIRRGLQGSGRIITSAGLIIVLVFLGFTLGDMLMIKQIGVALAVAVFVDMTIVRMVIVPAVMTVFGKWVWWSPKPLKKVYDRFKIEH